MQPFKREPWVETARKQLKERVLKLLSRRKKALIEVCDRLWSMPEPAMQESRTSAFLCKLLCKDVVELLLSRGAEVNARTNGSTPFLAPGLTTNRGLTPAFAAFLHSHKNVVKVLQKHGGRFP